jgi:hypothetical protein
VRNALPQPSDSTPYKQFANFVYICYIYLHKETQVKTRGSEMTILIALLVVGWVAASVVGSLAYFMGEQSKPIHERNWRSESFEKLAKSITGTEIDYANRTPAYVMDAYTSRNLPQ